MPNVQFADDVLLRLQECDSRYDTRGHLLVLSALQSVMDHLEHPRHISAAELAMETGELALERFGPMARTVLEYWGIRSTADFGEIVFALVDAGILVRQESDRIEDFVDVFDFEDLFEHGYPWGARL